MAASTAGDPADRSTHEMFWVKRQPLLKISGYDLRARFQPDWQPSWKDRPDEWADAEDSYPLPLRPNVIDAIHISTNSLVYIKKVGRDSKELQIATYLRSQELQADPRNCCVPIREVLKLPGDEEFSFMVMPFLRYMDSPKFERVGDVLQCGEKLLEGLAFLHQHNIAHRDCAYKNIMMDASALYPHGYHPIQEDYLPDLSRLAPVLPRTGANVKYYFVDFGISTQFAPEDENKLVTGFKGLDRSPPELSDTVPYDPFKLDVFILGNLFHEKFIEKYRDLRMLEPLVEKMTARDPVQRPSADGALREWQTLCKRANALTRGWRVQSLDESFLDRVVRDAVYPVSFVFKGIRRFAMSRGSPSPSPVV